MQVDVERAAEPGGHAEDGLQVADRVAVDGGNAVVSIIGQAITDISLEGNTFDAGDNTAGAVVYLNPGVDGAAIGGGLCLALAADIRVAASDAYFRAAGINTGLTASELGLSYLLPRAIGSSRAFEIMLTGRDVDGGAAVA